MKRITLLCTALIIASICFPVQSKNNSVCAGTPVPFGKGNLVIMKLEQDPAFTAPNAYNAALMVMEEYKIEADGSLTLVQSFNMPEESNGGNRRMYGIPRSTFSGTMSLSNDGQYIVTYGYDADKGATLQYNTGIDASINPIVLARISSDGVINTTTKLDTYKSEISGITSYDGSAFYFSGNMETANRGVGYIPLSGTTVSPIVTPADLSLMGGIRTLRYEKNFLFLNTWAKTFSITNALMPPLKESVITTIIPQATSGSSYSFTIVDTDPASPGTKLVMYQANDNMGIFKFSLVDGVWVNNGICLTSVAAVTTTILKSIVGKKNGEKVDLYLVENDRYNGRLLKFSDSTGYNEAINATSADQSLTVLQDLAGTDYSIRSVSWAPETKPFSSTNNAYELDNMFKISSNNGYIHIENNFKQAVAVSIYSIMGMKVKSAVLQDGTNSINMEGNTGLFILSVKGRAYKILLKQ